MLYGQGSNSLSNFYLAPKSVVALSLAADKKLDNTLREKFSRIMVTEFFSGGVGSALSGSSPPSP